MPRLCATRSVAALLLALPIASRSPASSEDPAPDPAELARELPRVPPRSPAEALASFRITAGFEVQLAACEPDVIDPVAMVFDEDGRMLVAEMRDYPFEPGKGQSPEQDARAKPGRVRLLEDLDGDGRVDRSRVYADGLSWPTGILPWKGGVFVTSAPDILYLKDEDGDGVADRREVVFTGFGKQNVQALLNSLRWGLDGKIWGSSGGNGGDVRRGGGGAVSLRGRDFRFRPGDTAMACGALELVTGGGQFGMCFDDWGNRFVCNNSNHVRLVAMESRHLDRNPYHAGPTPVIDIAEDGAAAPVFRASPGEPWRLVRTRWRAASAERSRYAATELVPIGFFTSATGILIYRGDAFPPEFRGNAFVGDVGGNLVHRKALEPRGTIFTARRPEAEKSSEFLVSTDNWFRPVGFAEGPDGALYVLDMYRETIEHPLSIPDSIKSFLDLKSGDDRGRIWRIVPRGFERRPHPRLSRAKAPELVARLESSSSWWRETAQRLLLERGTHEADELLRSLARETERPLARLHALWILAGLGALRPADLEAALVDREAGVREAAATLAERFLEPGPAIAPQLRARLCSLADDPSIRVRWKCALALGSLSDEESLDALVKVARRDADDEWLRAAILSSSAGRSGRILAALIDDPALKAQPLQPLVAGLAAVAGARDAAPEVALVLEAAARASSPEREPLRLAAVLGLGEGLRRAGRSLSTILAAPPAELAAAAAAVEPIFADAVRRACDRDLGAPQRTEAVRLLASARFALAGGALAKLLDAREPQEIQLAAVRALASFAEKGVGPLLVERWRSFSPPVRREAAEALFQRGERLAALLDGLEEGTVAPSDLDPERRKALSKHADAAVRGRALALLKEDVSLDRARVIERYRPALEKKGDAARGKIPFKRVCATCHRLGEEGHAVAPDFNTVRDRTPESLLIHILDPNREVAPPYVSYSVVASDGRALSGIIASETEASITLRRAEGVEEAILRSQVERLESSGLSLMPEGLEKDISIEEMSDLIEAIRAGS